MELEAEKASLVATRGFPQPLAFQWRCMHCLFYMIGGTFFLCGSAMYFPQVSLLVEGAWLFTIGSLGFTLSDGMEWWTNNRVGCFQDAAYRADHEQQVGYLMDPIDGPEGCLPSRGRRQRAANGINFLSSFIGSLLYFVGSICFFPAFGVFVVGGALYIIASAVIVTAQSCKLYRAGFDFANKSTFSEGFQAAHWSHDPPALAVDALAGIGGLCYFVGSICFLPQYDVDTAMGDVSAVWFQLGGVSYSLSSWAMAYRYFWAAEAKYPQ